MMTVRPRRDNALGRSHRDFGSACFLLTVRAAQLRNSLGDDLGRVQSQFSEGYIANCLSFNSLHFRLQTVFSRPATRLSSAQFLQPTWLRVFQTAGNLGGNAQRSRHIFNKAFLEALAEDFRKGGRQAIEKVRKNQPAAYMKICAILIPKEMKVEHSGGVKAMSDEQLEAAFELLQGMVDQRLGETAKVVEGKPAALPGPDVVLDGPSGHGGRGETAQAGEREDAIACGDVTSRCGRSVAP
jgi:hypothetical protein